MEADATFGATRLARSERTLFAPNSNNAAFPLDSSAHPLDSLPAFVAIKTDQHDTPVAGQVDNRGASKQR